MQKLKPGGGELSLKFIATVIVLMVVIIAITYLFADYQHRIKLKEVKIVYEDKIKVVTTQAKKFADNISIALTYLDTAREDLKNAKLNFEKTMFWLEEKNYREMKNASFNARFYFNRSHVIFEKSMYYLKLSANTSTEEYKEVIQYYINYTCSAINMTHYGKIMSSHLENASTYYLNGKDLEANQEMESFEEAKQSYDSFEEKMNEYLMQIKDYYNIRE